MIYGFANNNTIFLINLLFPKSKSVKKYYWFILSITFLRQNECISKEIDNFYLKSYKISIYKSCINGAFTSVKINYLS
jgi:hypothetical protein